MTNTVKNHELRISGTVQGVGFRPTVYRIATQHKLKGEVLNDARGVLVRLSATDSQVQSFLNDLQIELPPLANIDDIKINQPPKKSRLFKTFRITSSIQNQGTTEITADAATCTACIAEFYDPNNRRYLYPLINCTHCGPRMSFVHDYPYDRANTTMASFNMCDECLAEYNNPLNRRFHAQPISCYKCGPQLKLDQKSESKITKSTDLIKQSSSKLQYVVQALSQGKIVAIKGIGGFHLTCDATNYQSVSRLRKLKNRKKKPFAVMCSDISTVKNYCTLSEEESQSLQSVASPIVLLKKIKYRLENVPALSGDIAPGNHLLGIMLPYTPIYSYICNELKSPIVVTSGNLSSEPQIINDDEALNKLVNIADVILYHDRPIANRVDDSVIRHVSGKARVLRRARGFAPRSISLPTGFEKANGLITYGAELKSTFCLVKNGHAYLSQYQGDLEEANTYEAYENNIKLFSKLFQFTPSYHVVDKHPEYISSKLAREHAKEFSNSLIEVQHHHAHIASAMIENRLPVNCKPVLGIALDGLGYGDNSQLWGGEFILANYHRAVRVASFTPVPMPGGAIAAKQPWRSTYAHIVNAMPWDKFLSEYDGTELFYLLNSFPHYQIGQMLDKNINSPKASSVGRLFDAVAGALGISPQQIHFEGQAAIELESLVDIQDIKNIHFKSPYNMEVTQSSDNKQMIEIVSASIWPQLLSDIKTGIAKRTIAARFHKGLINTIIETVVTLSKHHEFDTVVLSGGCMQNGILLEALENVLQDRGFRCVGHTLVPANDGGIALGQAAVAYAQISKLGEPSTQILWQKKGI